MERKYGGALLDLGIHDIDLALWIQESPIKKEAKGTLDDATITLWHKNENKSIIKTRRENNFNAGLKAKSKTEAYLDFLNNKIKINDHQISLNSDTYFEEIKEFMEFLEGKQKRTETPSPKYQTPTQSYLK
jgi:predicted dehydrogenase